MTPYVSHWITRAAEDIRTIALLLREDGPPNPICFHAQQAAEKYLNGFLASRGIHIRKVHDLGSTLTTCEEVDNAFETLRDEAKYLDQFYLEARYSTEIPTFTRADAHRAAEAARRVKELVLPKIEQQ